MGEQPDISPPAARTSPWLERLVNGHEVHLWHLTPQEQTDESRLAAYRQLLSAPERERNARFVFERHRHADLLTRALVRTTLSRYHPAVDPRDWQFVAGLFGRPEIVGPRRTPTVQFNLSHTDGLIVCLVALGREVGVDVEDCGRIGSNQLDVADRYFSPQEVRALRSLPATGQGGRFFDYWTLKESYIKARGMGLQLPLDQFSFQLDADGPISISFGPRIADDPASWQFILRSPTPRHRLALAIRRRNEPDLAVRSWPAFLASPADPDDLLLDG